VHKISLICNATMLLAILHHFKTPLLIIKILMGHMLSSIAVLATFNMHTKFELSSFIHSKIRKGAHKFTEMGKWGAYMDHSR